MLPSKHCRLNTNDSIFVSSQSRRARKSASQTICAEDELADCVAPGVGDIRVGVDVSLSISLPLSGVVSRTSPEVRMTFLGWLWNLCWICLHNCLRNCLRCRWLPLADVDPFARRLLQVPASWVSVGWVDLRSTWWCHPAIWTSMRTQVQFARDCSWGCLSKGCSAQHSGCDDRGELHGCSLLKLLKRVDVAEQRAEERLVCEDERIREGTSKGKRYIIV